MTYKAQEENIKAVMDTERMLKRRELTSSEKERIISDEVQRSRKLHRLGLVKHRSRLGKV